MIEQRWKINDFYAQMVDFRRPGHIFQWLPKHGSMHNSDLGEFEVGQRMKHCRDEKWYMTDQRDYGGEYFLHVNDKLHPIPSGQLKIFLK